MKRMCVVSAATWFLAATVGLAEEVKPDVPQATTEHGFLKQFVGDWECDVDAFTEPGKPPTKMKSSMSAHMIGSFWAVVVVKGEAYGQPYHGQALFGYDAQDKKKFIGTWSDSMSDFLWRYEGVVVGNRLVLESEGPNPAEPGKMIKARDTWDFKSENVVVLTGQMEGPDGEMMTMMTATCRRKK